MARSLAGVSEPFVFTAEVWQWEGKAAWHFVSLPETVADDIAARFGHTAAGFGSLPVEVAIGATRWKTSVFPDSKRGTYLLPLKKAVRVAEGLDAGSAATVSLAVVA